MADASDQLPIRRGGIAPAWACVWAGIIAAVLGLIVSSIFPGAVLLRLALLGGGLLTAAIGVRLKLKVIPVEFEQRMEAASLVALAGVGPVLVMLAVDRAWDSAPIFLAVLIAASVLGAIVLLLPPTGRRVMLSVLAVLHFTAITAAVTSIELPGIPAPWLANQVWARLYRPYLQVVGLTNAYHFYSPEPGPPTLVWFRIQYESGRSRWVKLPYWEQSAVPLHYQRRLSLTEACNQSLPQPNERTMTTMLERRNREGQVQGIPIHPDVILGLQYREPTVYSRLMISAFVRYIARRYPEIDDEGRPAKIKSVRVYRVVHAIISAAQMAAGMDPVDPTLHWPYYLGEYDAKGEALHKADDPLLWWMIPVYRDASGEVHDCFKSHSGDDPWNPITGRKLQ
jgi:hypothetical protein